jgi:hypothetical protein
MQRSASFGRLWSFLLSVNMAEGFLGKAANGGTKTIHTLGFI